MIHISYNRHQYQEDMIQHVEIDDTVVELGCHVGTSTRILSRLAQDGRVYAYDNSPESTRAMRKLRIEYPNVVFENADVREIEVINKLLEAEESIDVLCIDLGGGYHPDTVFKVFFLWSSLLTPKITLIRNRGLLDFINTAVASEDIKSTEGYLSSAYYQIRPK